MASGGVSWLFQIYDRVSAPAKTIAGNLGVVDKSMQRMTESAKKAEGGMAGLARKFITWEFYKDVLEGIASKIYELGKELAHTAIEAAAFKRQSMFSLEVLTNSSTAAKGIFEWVERVAGKTGTASENIMQMAQGFIKVGASAPVMERLVQLSMDIASTRGAAVGQGFAESISKMMQSPSVLPRDFKAAGLALGNYEEIMERVAKSTGISMKVIRAKLGEFGSPEVTGPLKEAALDALVKFGIDKYSKGGIGKATEEHSKFTEQAYGRIRENLKRLMSPADSTPGPIAGLLGRIADAMDPASASGKRLVAIIDSLTEGVAAFGEGFKVAVTPLIPLFERLSISEGHIEIENFMYRLGVSAGGLLTTMMKLIDAWDTFTGGVVAAKTALGGDQGGWAGKFKRWMDPLKESGGFTPASLAALEAGPTSRYETGYEGQMSLLEGSDDAAERHSPSAAWRRRGAYDAQGYREGLQSSSSVSASGGGGGARVEIHQEFNIQTGPGVPADQVAQRIAALSLGELQSALDTAAAQMGTG